MMSLRKIFKSPAAFLAAWLLASAGGISIRAQEPIAGDVQAHDPSTMVRDGSRYYLFRTGSGIPGKWSTDLRTWNYAGQVFPSGPPSWVTNAVPGFANNTFWAPDIAYFNGKYHLYYSASSWGSIDSAIGLVTSPSLSSPAWVDQGKVVQSDATAGVGTDTTTINCIDPSVLVDTNGSVWLSFGSYFDGIVVTQIDPATGKRLPGSPLTRVASSSSSFLRNSTEASYLYQRGGYYYLFINYGSCCSGIDSTYNIRVGRSTSVTGPYLDRNNVSLLGGGGTVFLETSGKYIGPGHAGIFAENGTNWFTYHYYDGNDNGTAKLGLAQLYWTADGWPLVTNDWSAFYTFDVDAREHRAQYNGALQMGASIVTVPGRGRVLELNGSDAFALLPNPVANANSFAAWVYWNGGADWQRVFDFGNGTGKYFFLTPRSGQGTMRFGITLTGGGAGEGVIDAPFALPTNSWVHVAVTLDGVSKRGLLYFNGKAVGTNNNITARPWQTMARTNYIGKSQYADPLFKGRIDSFRIFGRTLTGADVEQLSRVHPALAHRYSFDGSSADSIGAANGRVVGSAVITNGYLRLPGTTGSYFNMPGGLVSGSSAVTLECWVTLGGNANWARIFDFGAMSGTSGANFLFYSPRMSATSQRFGFSTSQGTANLDVSGTALDNRSLHMVCIVDPSASTMMIYTNAVLMAARTGAMPPLTSVSTDWSFLGRSLFSADPFLSATIDEFRVYDGRLAPDEISASYEAGPDALSIPVVLTTITSPGSITLAWPSYAVGYTLEFSGSPAGPWGAVPIAPVLSGNQWTVTVATASGPRFFRLKQTNGF